MGKCMMYCPNGFEKDANGCDVCMCARAEEAVGKACSRHEDCGVWEYCSFGNGCRRRRAGGHAELAVGALPTCACAGGNQKGTENGNKWGKETCNADTDCSSGLYMKFCAKTCCEKACNIDKCSDCTSLLNENNHRQCNWVDGKCSAVPDGTNWRELTSTSECPKAEEEVASVVGGNGSRCRRGMVWSSYRNRCVRTLVDTEKAVGGKYYSHLEEKAVGGKYYSHLEEEELASVVGGNGSRCRRGMVWSSYRNRCVRSLVDT